MLGRKGNDKSGPERNQSRVQFRQYHWRLDTHPNLLNNNRRGHKLRQSQTQKTHKSITKRIYVQTWGTVRVHRGIRVPTKPLHERGITFPIPALGPATSHDRDVTQDSMHFSKPRTRGLGVLSHRRDGIFCRDSQSSCSYANIKGTRVLEMELKKKKKKCDQTDFLAECALHWLKWTSKCLGRRTCIMQRHNFLVKRVLCNRIFDVYTLFDIYMHPLRSGCCARFSEQSVRTDKEA